MKTQVSQDNSLLPPSSEYSKNSELCRNRYYIEQRGRMGQVVGIASK
jgi:hypothetical protein